ncbi:lytic transglycosylase domain-containing protein [Aureimonas psammosilenae]|uniref:lytic transglycosylase domain-containing protein n=1 Tax=Aureimonas psammosilenae TaxID=2495496 RepID=UPI001260B631|nr:lytic transglycosylase domain-containing protein [Aureimonas psammosilenae]
MSDRHRARRAILATSVFALLCSDVGAQSLPSAGPVPALRPSADIGSGGVAIDPARFGAPQARHAPNPLVSRAAPAPQGVDTDTSAFTASISQIASRPSDIRAVAGQLKDGMDAISSGDLRRARAIREGMRPGSLDRHILQWAIALNGGIDVPAQDIATAAAELRGWPGMKRLRANSERALYREQPSASEVINAFGNSKPQTPEGAMALAKAYLEVGQAGAAKRTIATVWRGETLDRSMEAKILQQFGAILTRADHKTRMDMLLYKEKVSDADRVKTMAGAEKLFAARAAVIREDARAGALLSAVPAAQRSDPGYLYAMTEYYRKKDKVAEAAEILLKAPRDRESLVDADAWWNERRIIARDLLDLGRTKDAYRVASAHAAETPSDAADAEFHAGWIALRFLRDPQTAAKHFARIAEVSNRPLSQSRAYYWLGRTAEATRSGNAGRYYAQAALNPTTFYGQLASAKLGRRPNDIAYPRPSSAERQRFESREAVRAIRRLEEIGLKARAETLYRNLGDDLESPGELALLAAMAESRGNHYLSLKVGKQANTRGIDAAAALAFPVGVIPASANISASGKALAYAIARQESEFRPDARSGAGALGLLQLMPATAKTLAAQAGMAYNQARLTTDVAYNAVLGSRYLGQQIDNFSGSYVLTFAAYNAGPRRAREWIQRFGDPRGRPVDEVVDWVERIPFTETRNYVQRVMENYQVYKMRLGADSNIETDLVVGRRG